MGFFSRTVTIKADGRLIHSIKDSKGNLSVEKLREIISYESRVVQGMSSETRGSEYGRNHSSILAEARSVLEKCEAVWAKGDKVKLEAY